MCMYNCPTNNITIEDGIVYGICSRCGVCSEVCSNRVDGYELEKSKQLNLINAFNNNICAKITRTFCSVNTSSVGMLATYGAFTFWAPISPAEHQI